jgi:hypothetical protein
MREIFLRGLQDGRDFCELFRMEQIYLARFP